MSTTDDYYRVLGVARDASRADVQRAYRLLARRHHPDVSPADEQRFRRITEAYRVLSDPHARARHDRGRAAQGVRVNRRRGPTTSLGHLDIEDLLGGFAATGRPGPGHRTGFGWPAATGADLTAEIEISVEDAYTGGRGQVTVNTADGIRRCEVTVPAGAVDGQRIRLAGMGAVAPGAGPAGDLYLVVRLTPHPRYRVHGRDLSVELPVTPWEAVLGATVSVHTPSGPVQVDLPAGSSTGRRLRLRGRGMPQPHGTPGDLYAEVKIVVPAQPSDVERALCAARRAVAVESPHAGILSGAAPVMAAPVMTDPGPPSGADRGRDVFTCRRADIPCADARSATPDGGSAAGYPVSRHDGHGLTMTLRWRCRTAHHRPFHDLS